MIKHVFVALTLALSAVAAAAQPVGQLPAGYVWGNPLSGQANARAASITEIIDRAACAADNSGLLRQSGIWSCLSSTGTGNFVRATAPTITNPAITGGSINNTPIGASTRSTGQFTILQSNGLAQFTAGVNVSGSGINVGGFTRAQLDTLFGLNNSGKMAIGWNYRSGSGDTNFFISRNGGSRGGLAVWDFPNTTGDPVLLFDVSGNGGVTVGLGDLFLPAANAVSWTGRATVKSPADSVITLLNNAETDFGRLQFGGTTAAFPALRRASSSLQARLADDSADANFYAASMIASGNIQVGPSQIYTWLGRSRMSSPADGVITFSDNAGADFSRLQFGGTTASFPSLKRSGTAIHARAADDSGFVNFAANVLFSDALTANRLVATDGSKNMSSSITSANLAASITDETGTGANVFATGPTLSGPAVTGAIFMQGATSGQTTLQAAAVAGTTNFRLPGTNGTSGQVLQTDGSGNTSWVAAAGGGTVTSVAAGTGMSFTTITSSGSVAIDKATASNFFAATANKVLTSDIVYTAETTTTYGATTTFNFDTFINTAVTLTGNITTQTLSNVRAGKAGTITFIQGGAGNFTTVWNSILKFPGGNAPTLSTAVGAVDVLAYHCRSATFCAANLMKDVK